MSRAYRAILSPYRAQLRPYQAILSARFRTLLQYRAAAAAGFGTQLFWGLIRSMIFAAFYHSTTAPQPMSLPQVITYVWLGQAMFGLLPWNIDPDFRDMVRKGTVAYELLRPVDLYGLWYARALAARTAPTLLRAVPIFVIAGCFFGLLPPPSFAAALAWLTAMLGALLLSCALSNLMTISQLWTVSGEGILRAAPVLIYLLSGMLIPLLLFPAWAQPIIDFLPFRDLVDLPFRLYMGNLSPGRIGFVAAHQTAWIVALVLLGQSLLCRGTRRLVIQGG